MNVGSVGHSIESGVVNSLREPLELFLVDSAAERFARKRASEIDVADVTRALKIGAEVDEELAGMMQAVGLRANLKPKNLQALPEYGDVFAPSGALTENYALIKEGEANKDVTFLQYLTNPDQRGLQFLKRVLGAFRNRFVN